MNRVLSTPKAVLQAMARSISPDIYKSFTARYTKDIALEVRRRRFFACITLESSSGGCRGTCKFTQPNALGCSYRGL